MEAHANKEMSLEKSKSGKLPFGVKFSYGGAEFASSGSWNLIYIFLLYFFTDAVGINPALAGTVLMIATLWDAVTDPAIGIVSDNMKSKWGRRRPFLLISALPFGVFTWLVFTDFNLGSGWTLVYYVGMVIMFFTFYTMVQVPYTALAAEMTQDYNERMGLVSFRIGWAMVAALFSAGLPLLLVGYFREVLGSTRAGWSAMAAVFGVVGVFFILLTWRTTRGYEAYSENTGFKLSDLYSVIRHNRTFRYTLGLWTFGVIATNFAIATGVYFFTYVMGFDENMTSAAFATIVIASFVYIPLIDFVAKKKSKRVAFLVFGSIWAIFGIFWGFLITGPEDEIFMWISLMTSGAIGTCLIYMLGWAMIPDVTEVDELMSGQRREGLYFGIMAFIQKLGSAVTLQVIGLILAWIGYQPEVAQTPQVLKGIRYLLFFVPAVFIVPACIIAYLMPMTREKHQALCDILKLKRENREYDITPVKDLI